MECGLLVGEPPKRAVTDEEAKGKFPRGWKALKPYLRLTPQPGR